MDRPYRAALTWEEIRAIMRRDTGTSIRGDVFAALTTYVESGAITPRESALRAYRVA